MEWGMNIQPGDKVLSDLDGQIYEVVKYGSTDEIEPLQGAKRTGYAMVVINEDGQTHMLYSWEATKIEKSL
jgi:hypothetical protein